MRDPGKHQYSDNENSSICINSSSDDEMVLQPTPFFTKAKIRPFTKTAKQQTRSVSQSFARKVSNALSLGKNRKSHSQRRYSNDSDNSDKSDSLTSVKSCSSEDLDHRTDERLIDISSHERLQPGIRSKGGSSVWPRNDSINGLRNGSANGSVNGSVNGSAYESVQVSENGSNYQFLGKSHQTGFGNDASYDQIHTSSTNKILTSVKSFKKRLLQSTSIYISVAVCSLVLLCWRHYTIDQNAKNSDFDDDFPLLVLPGQLTQAQIEANLEALFGEPDPDFYDYEESENSETEADYDDGYPTAVPRKTTSKIIMKERKSSPPSLDEIDSGNVDQYRVKDYHFNVGHEEHRLLKKSEEMRPIQPVLLPTMPSLMKLREETFEGLERLREDRENRENLENIKKKGENMQWSDKVPPSDGPLLPLEAMGNIGNSKTTEHSEYTENSESIQKLDNTDDFENEAILPLQPTIFNSNDTDTDEIAPTSMWLENQLVVNITLPRNVTAAEVLMLNLEKPTENELEPIKQKHQTRFERHQKTSEGHHQDIIPTKKFPKMIIIGAKKCGTTPLKMFLSHHPQFRDRPGEKHFFDKNENWEKGFEFYLDQMEHSFDDEINFEKTSDYFDRNLVPERIAQLNESIKLVAVLCDPVQRAVSHYNHILNNVQNEKNPAYVKLKGFVGFDDLLDSSFSSLLGTNNVSSLSETNVKKKIDAYQQNLLKKGRQAPPAPEFLLTGGAYSTHLSRWYKHFSKDQIHLVNGAELTKDPGGVMMDIAEFMNVDPLINREHFVMDEEKGFYCIKSGDTGQDFCVGDHSKHGKSRRLSDKHPLSENSRFRLEDFYAPFMDELETITGRRDFRESWTS